MKFHNDLSWDMCEEDKRMSLWIWRETKKWDKLRMMLGLHITIGVNMFCKSRRNKKKWKWSNTKVIYARAVNSERFDRPKKRCFYIIYQRVRGVVKAIKWLWEKLYYIWCDDMIWWRELRQLGKCWIRFIK